ncbi:MAG TPA: glycosyltransferase family 39 protein [Gaiellaceae bacterium]
MQPTFLAMLRRVAHTESTPPLWYAIAWLVHHAGVPLQSERLLSVAFGAIFAAAVVSLAHRFVALPLATVAGLMTALGAEFVLHGAELRAYELFAFLSVALGLCLLGMLERASRRSDIALAATVAAGCLTHYFFAFSVAAVLGWLWFDPGARNVRRRGTAAVAIGGVVAASCAPVMFTQYSNGRFRWIGSFRWRGVAAVPLRLFTYSYSHVPVGPALSGATIVVISIGGLFLARRSAGGRLVVLLAAGPIATAAVAWAAGMPIFDLRNLIGVGAYVAVLTVGALDALSNRLSMFGAMAVVAAIAVSLAASNAERIPAYDAMARSLVQRGWTVSKPILVYGDPYRYRLPFEWYLPRQPVLDMSHVLDGTCAEVFVVTFGGKIKRERLQADTPLHRGTLLVDPGHRPRCVGLRSAQHTLADA